MNKKHIRTHFTEKERFDKQKKCFRTKLQKTGVGGGKAQNVVAHLCYGKKVQLQNVFEKLQVAKKILQAHRTKYQKYVIICAILRKITPVLQPSDLC